MIKLRPISEAKKDNETVIWAVFRKDLVEFTGRPDLDAWAGVQAPLVHPGIQTEGRYAGLDIGWRVALQVGCGGFPDTWLEGWVPVLDTSKIVVEETPWPIERQVEHIVKTSPLGIRLHAIMSRVSGFTKSEINVGVREALSQLRAEQKIKKHSWSYVWIGEK